LEILLHGFAADIFSIWPPIPAAFRQMGLLVLQKRSMRDVSHILTRAASL
jgi:hypothetical protein